MSQLFRAIPQSKFISGEKNFRKNSIRYPSNIPYVVDNVLEWLRPLNMPCRRNAIYASPSVELALKNASAPLMNGDTYEAYSLKFHGDGYIKAQLKVKDARYHSDIKLIQRIAIDFFSSAVQEENSVNKIKFGMIFMPGSSKNELESAYKNFPIIFDFLEHCKTKSEFWGSASNVISAESDGELFFEILDEDTYYQLEDFGK